MLALVSSLYILSAVFSASPLTAWPASSVARFAWSPTVLLRSDDPAASAAANPAIPTWSQPRVDSSSIRLVSTLPSSADGAR